MFHAIVALTRGETMDKHAATPIPGRWENKSLALAWYALEHGDGISLNFAGERDGVVYLWVLGDPQAN